MREKGSKVGRVIGLEGRPFPDSLNKGIVYFVGSAFKRFERATATYNS